jgi:CIC family chloride channel protein
MTIVGFCAVMFMHFTGHYYVQGIGYATVQDVLSQVIKNAWFLIFLFFMKLLLTGVSLGSGGSGGVFSPGIFMGATLGGGVGLLAKQIDPHIPINMVSSGVVGIAAMLSSTVSAPITAVVMSFEMTRDYKVVVPSMIAAGVAFGVRRMIIHYSIDTFKLEKQGFHIPEIYVRVLHYPHKDD